MRRDPLAPPSCDSEVLGLFLRHFGIRRDLSPESLLGEVVRAFSLLPYENLTKIVKHEACGSAEGARRLPGEVVGDHVAFGAGGTCFSLTAALLHLVRALGWRAEPILADRRYGQNTHCALLVYSDGVPNLLDPGFLILRPVPIARGLLAVKEGVASHSIQTAFNEVVLVPKDGGAKLDLLTIQGGSRTYRLTFRLAPADPGEFLKAWDASFGWDMMRYPLLNRVAGGKQIYLQGRKLQVRDREGVGRSEVAIDKLPRLVASQFGLPPGLAETAIAILKRRGELIDDPRECEEAAKDPSRRPGGTR